MYVSCIYYGYHDGYWATPIMATEKLSRNYVAERKYHYLNAKSLLDIVVIQLSIPLEKWCL